MAYPIGEVAGIGNILLCGINVWQYVTAQRDVSRPHLKKVFLLEAVLNLVSGVYLILSG